MKKILFFCAHGIKDAGCRYRVYQFLPHLQRAHFECDVFPFSTDRLFDSLQTNGRWITKTAHTLFCCVRRVFQLLKISHYDCVIIHREAFPFFVPTVERFILSRHPYVFFSFDDAVYEGHGDTAALNHPFLYSLKYGEGINHVLREAQHIIAGNRVLAEHARQFNENVAIIPTVVDCDRYVYSPHAADGGPLTIGWIGSRSTVGYLRDIEPVLCRISAVFRGRIRFRFVGAPDYRPELPDSESVAFELEKEIAELRSFDIGLMPLPDTPWTRGKCAFKAIQYMAIGVPTIASPVGAAADLITHGKNGMLAISTEEWFDFLRLLIENFELRSRLAAAARKTIEESYSLQQWGPRLAKVISAGFAAKRGGTSVEIHTRQNHARQMNVH